MFDEHQRRNSGLNTTPPLAVIGCGAGAMLLSFGLCGASSWGHAVQGLGSAAVVLFGLSILAILVGFFWLVVIAVINAFRR